MHRLRELVARLRHRLYTVAGRGHHQYMRLYRQFLTLYLPVVTMTAVTVTQFGRTAALISATFNEIGLTVAQFMDAVAYPVILVMNDVALVTMSTMDTMALLTAYAAYVWIDLIIQVVQTVMQLPSAEPVTDIEVPGGITVWLLILFALATYGVVYHQYPTYEDWVSTVLSIVLPFLSRWLWKSD